MRSVRRISSARAQAPKTADPQAITDKPGYVPAQALGLLSFLGFLGSLGFHRFHGDPSSGFATAGQDSHEPDPEMADQTFCGDRGMSMCLTPR